MSLISQTISVRLSAEHVNELDRRALQNGQNRSDYVRQLLVDALTSEVNEDTRNRIAEIQDDIKKLREDVWSATAILLPNAGKVSADAAKTWVQKNLILS